MPKPSGNTPPPIHPRGEWVGVALLACALVFNAFFLAPELWIGKAPLNDSVFHLAASERLAESFSRGEPFLDPWVSEWSLGYPVWRSYQPLGHLLAAAFLRSTESFASHAAAFATLQYLVLVLLPGSVYCGTRLLTFSPAAAGLASLLVLAPSAAGELGRYGLSYGAVTWRGSGLYTQVVALHLLVLSLGFVARSLDSGNKRTAASLFLAGTALSHIIFGYVAFVSAVLLAIVGQTGERSRRLVRLATILVPSLLLLAWFVVPLFFGRYEINHSRWEPPFKWDSFGAPFILNELVSGRLLDGGRVPLLSLLFAIGGFGACYSLREATPRRLLMLTAFWLALFFGRETWGHALLLVGVPSDLHLHRLQAAFELSAVLLAAWGIERAILILTRVDRWFALGAVGCVAVALVAIGVERARYLEQNKVWGEHNLVAFEGERVDLEAAFTEIRKILAERPGRVSAGKAASWGREFKIGSVPVYAFVTREHLDQVSFLYHAMSLPSDVMVLRDEHNAVHDMIFGVRAVIAPAGQRMPPHLQLRSVHGRLAVYESSREGYFGLIDIGASYTGGLATAYDANTAWLKSRLAHSGVVIALDGDVPGVPLVGRWEKFSTPTASLTLPRGRIVSEEKIDETYRARMVLERDAYALIKITWHPDLAATVNGKPVSPIRVTPGFAAVPLPAGEHELVMSYRPSQLKLLLLIFGVSLFALCGWLLSQSRSIPVENSVTTCVAKLGARLSTPRIMTGLALAGLVILSMHPLFRGRLIDGHDAQAYPPRLVEMTRALSDGHVPPVWAPDLGNGHGQPLFQFAPPLIPAAAVPFFASGLRITDSLQLALALLFTVGAIAMYRIGRGMAGSRSVALAGSAAWLFAPYVSLDLYVRAAFAEAAALAVAPVALLGLLRALDQPSAVRVAIASVAIALVPLAHNAVALLLIPVLALIVFVRGTANQQPLRSISVGLVTLLAGLGLSAYFWMPALLEKEFVKTELLRQDFLAWSLHAISPFQILWSRWGYGLSARGASDGMSFALGPLHLLLAVWGIVIALRANSLWRKANILGFTAAAAAGAWLATEWAAPVWSRVETLQYLAYPWRALMLPALFLPLLAMPAFERLGHRGRTAVLALLIVVNLPHTEPKGFLTFDDEFYWRNSIAQRGINTTTREEYEPRWVKHRPAYTSEKLKGLRGDVEVREISINTVRQEFIVRAEAETTVEAATFYYPGWSVTVGGESVPVSPAETSGTMLFQLPKGEHQVVIELLPTPVRRYAALVTAATAGGLGLLLLLRWLLGLHAVRLLLIRETAPANTSHRTRSAGTGARAAPISQLPTEKHVSSKVIKPKSKAKKGRNVSNLENSQ